MNQRLDLSCVGLQIWFWTKYVKSWFREILVSTAGQTFNQEMRTLCKYVENILRESQSYYLIPSFFFQ